MVLFSTNCGPYVIFNIWWLIYQQIFKDGKVKLAKHYENEGVLPNFALVQLTSSWPFMQNTIDE